MPSKFEFDDTRAAIGADKLDDSERRAMLDKFKSAGGQVLNEKAVRPRSTAEPVVPRKPAGGGPSKRLPSEERRENARLESEKAERARADLDSFKKKIGSPLARLFLKIRTAVAGVAPFGSDTVSPKFMNFLALDFKQAAVEMNLVGNDLFLRNSRVGKKIVSQLDAKNPILMECLEAAHRLYTNDLFAALLEGHNSSPGYPVSLESIEKPLKEIYRRLYYLYPFQETLKKAHAMALEVYIREAGADSKLSAPPADLSRLFARDVRTIFHVAFPKLFLLICRADGLDYPPFTPFFEKSIGIDPNKKFGRRRKGDSEIMSSGELTDESEASSDEDSGPDSLSPQQEKAPKEEKRITAIMGTREYQYGMQLMRLQTPPQLRLKVAEKHKFDDLPFSDKVLLSFMYFMEFDIEYSFVLTTNKIKLNPDYSSGVKIDYKKSLADLYNESRAIIIAFDKYGMEVKELAKVRTVKGGNYIENSKLVSKAEARVGTEGRNVRALTRVFMEKVVQNLARFIDDMKGSKTIVENAEETITLDPRIESGKRLNGKTVAHCIMEAYCYAVALRERLEHGDLFGGVIEMSDDEMMESFGSTFRAEAPENPVPLL